MLRRIAMEVAALVLMAAPGVLNAQPQKGSPAPKKAATPPTQSQPAKPADAPAPPSSIQAKKVQRTDVVNDQNVQDFEKKDRIAVIAAVGRYGDDLPALQFTMADAVELSAEMKRQGYKVFTLLNNEATADNLRQRLDSIATQIQPQGGTLLFAFSGHGFQTADGRNFLATYGTTVDALEQRGLAVAEVEALMKKSGARRSILFVDACRNVPGEKSARTPRSFQALSEAEGVRVLLSTRPGGFSYEDSALQHGIFTHFILEALRGKAAGPDGKVTFDDLASYVENKVFDYTSSKNFIQKPFHTGEASGDFLLATATPLKEEEVTKAKESSGAKNVTNDSVILKRQGQGDSFMVVVRENSLFLYQAPNMTPFARLDPKAASGLQQNQKRFEGTAGVNNQMFHAVVRFDKDNVPVELVGRLGTKCTGGCQNVQLPGEAASFSSTAGKGSSIAKAGGRLSGLLGGSKGARAAATTDAGAEAVQATTNNMNWTAFTLLPEQKMQ